jgi:aspartyl-tRNA synthetase
MGKTSSSRRFWLVYVNVEDGTYKSSVDKFYDQADLSTWATLEHCQRYDLRIGPADKTRSN